MISKNGGGVGVYLGRIRPSNSLVKNYAGANVINVWVKIIDDMAPAWNQCHIENSEVDIVDSIEIDEKIITDKKEIQCLMKK